MSAIQVDTVDAGAVQRVPGALVVRNYDLLHGSVSAYDAKS